MNTFSDALIVDEMRSSHYISALMKTSSGDLQKPDNLRLFFPFLTVLSYRAAAIMRGPYFGGKWFKTVFPMSKDILTVERLILIEL